MMMVIVVTEEEKGYRMKMMSKGRWLYIETKESGFIYYNFINFYFIYLFIYFE